MTQVRWAGAALALAMGCAKGAGSDSRTPAEDGHPATAQPAPPATAAPVNLRVRPIALPGSPERVTMDYIAYDPESKLLWVPAGNTKRVDVIDTTTDALIEIPGFPTAQREARGVVRYLGPSSVAIGPHGLAFVGNRGDSKVCAVDAKTKTIGACASLMTPPDGVAYVAATKEIWVTTPREKTITIIDAADVSALKVASVILLDGAPEGYAVDDARALFYTNLEDKDRTLVIDVRKRTVRATWKPSCGDDGPRGLAYDAPRRHLYVACTDRIVAMNPDDGAVLGTLATGAGVDNIDYAAASGHVYVAAGTLGTIVVAAADDRGVLTKVGEAKTAVGARVVVAGAGGRAFVADSAGGRILVVEPQP